ncbi:MAG: hypothetical protein H6744_12965 [Deltaproteobacteria bacterium]|nr:hypothetical protein [Deltaproteobacteria bacterium]
MNGMDAAPLRSGTRWQRLGDARWFRLTVTGLVGLALFVIGVMYLDLDREPDVTSFLVVSGAQARAGQPLALRVSGHLADARRSTPVSVSDVHIGGAPATATVSGDDPAIVTVPVPSDVGETVALTMRADSDHGGATLEAELPVVHGRATGLPELARSLSQEVTTDHRVTLLPESGELAANMDNRVYVRVLSREGAPVSGARVTVTHASLPDGAVHLVTDASGLAAFTLAGNQPSFRLAIDVRSGELHTETDALFRPYGRRMRLELWPPVVAPGDAVTAKLTTWEAEVRVFCDVLVDGAWVRSEQVTTAEGKARLDLGTLPVGLHQLQCYEHPLDPGESFATAPILVATGPELPALLAEVRARALVVDSSAVAPPGTDAALAAGYWQAVLRELPRPPQILSSTRETDLADRKARHDRRKARLLLSFAGVLLLVFLWVAEHIVKHTIDTRDRIRAFAIESEMEGDDADVDALLPASSAQRHTLVRARGVLLAAVVLGAILANVLGLIALFAMIR